tara:strand:- start:48 stop:386 length:339 start_codon:yes stop_codon:yes gene_type:complete
MRLIFFVALFLVPLIGLACFAFENETTEIINEVYNQTSDTKKPWYNTWWAILINVIILVPFSALVFLGLLGLFLRIIIRLSKIKNFWKLFFTIFGIAVIVLFVVAIIGLSLL